MIRSEIVKPGVVDRVVFAEPKKRCPFCREITLVGIYQEASLVLLNPQKRLVVFDSKPGYETGEFITGFEELSGKMVVGRPATKEEVEEFKKAKKLSNPWTIARVAHWRTCEKWDWSISNGTRYKG
jgi:hypothetical protein